jgi:hypothetical protein
MKILKLNFWKGSNEKYANDGVKDKQSIHILDVGRREVQMWLKVCIEKYKFGCFGLINHPSLPHSAIILHCPLTMSLRNFCSS